ncbi:protocadherin gamma-A4-like [Rhineura floridana]|uniref:protocadherin gamma-A4-like n=1 Tax=Rhineura floridana TaxID=261503 RepID=UPI002AC7E88E|nr:protocadherin gamma-A4-like [Rhineura floridana]
MELTVAKRFCLWVYKDTAFISIIFFCIICEAVTEQIHYSIPEEMPKGSFVGNIAKDLRLDIKDFSHHGVSFVCRGKMEYFALNNKSGHLYMKERLDRELTCPQVERCLFSCEVILESAMKIYRIEIEIIDINDNAPSFKSDIFQLKISEVTEGGTRFRLHDAHDPDLGMNSVQSYKLSVNRHFSLDVQTGLDGAIYAEIILETPLDREEQTMHDLILTAFDGGDPAKSGTTQIHISVLDANDNAPIFSQPVYTVTVAENVLPGYIVVIVKATDLDEGINREVTYSFKKISDTASQNFYLNPETGEIILVGKLDYEESTLYEIEIQGTDGGGLFNISKAVIFVSDVNDNIPEIAVRSLTHSVPEDSPTGTAIALLNVHDEDSGENGKVICSIPTNIPFQLTKTFDNYYTMVIARALDREQVAAYNITITASDQGVPPLSSKTLIVLQILDKNDNAPDFVQAAYTFYLAENNQRGASIFHLKAEDPDWGENSKTIYSIIESQIIDSSLSSYLSINSDTGVVYALHSFDYEEFREIRFLVKAQDGGSPPLSSNVSVTLFILDQNDNAPEILYPSPPTDGSTGIELAPRSSEPGYLVTKVVAVDVDSGQNAWLSYQLIKATEPGLFTLGLHTGEIRTARFFLEKDALKQSLVVLVKDNGQPPLSASVTVTVVLADSISDILTDLSNVSVSADPQSDLTSYLVIAVAFVSCLFFAFLLVLLALRFHRWRNSQLCDNASVNFNSVPVSQFVGIDGVRAFLQSYCHEVSLTSGSRKSQILFPIGSCSNTLVPQQAPDEPGPLLVIGDSNTIKKEAATCQVSM